MLEQKKAPYSVLMSVYEKETAENLRQSVESVFAQTVLPSEFVLVIDGKIGPELQNEVSLLSEKFKIKEVYLPQNLGLGLALNAGLKHCTNEIVARMDSDDIAMPQRIEKQLELIEQTNADIVSCAVCEFEGSVDNVTATKNVPQTHEEIMGYLRRRNPFNHPAVVYKKSVITSLGGYENYNFFEDYELFARALSKGFKGANHQEALLYMRAGNAMYNRRGGRQYVSYIRRFYKRMEELGLCSLKDKLFCVFPRIVIALAPGFLRRFIYKTLLRG